MAVDGTFPELYSRLHYAIIEKSPAMRERQKAILNDRVKWYTLVQDINGITGCVLSNELLDDFSVHRVVTEDQLKEVFIDYTNGFVELLVPAHEKLKNYFADLNVQLPTGFETEINLEAINWLKEISLILEKAL